VSRIILILLATAALLGAATVANASSHHKKTPPQCPSHRAHSHKLKADAQAELYTAPKNPEYPEFLYVYGCTYKNKRSHLLGPVPEAGGGSSGGTSSGVILEALAGVVVADAWLEGAVEVRDLATGRVLHVVYASAVGAGTPRAIVVTKDGTVAWTMGPTPEQRDYQVHVVDGGGVKLVASSPEVEPFSLSLTRNTLYWAEAGIRKSVVLR
jgi:hypothetical protein